jgi:hypothetical protein
MLTSAKIAGKMPLSERGVDNTEHERLQYKFRVGAVVVHLVAGCPQGVFVEADRPTNVRDVDHRKRARHECTKLAA